MSRIHPSAMLVLAASLVASPTLAQPFSAQDRTTVDRLCRASASLPPSPLALDIATGAAREHAAFGGHVIDRNGRILRFGAVESDAFRDEAGGRGVPWRQVLRYWESLGPIDGSPLQVRRFPGLAEDAAATGASDLRPLPDLIDRLTRSSLPAPEREAAIQAAIRAAIGDIPWSAAFVSHVAIGAGIARSRFAAAMAHLDYVTEAARHSSDEIAGRPASSFYRACDPRRTALRPGDLLCLHRHSAADIAALTGDAGLYAALVPALARGERPVWNLHCDIVVARDDRRRTVTLIGGNVLQSVARRDLPTDSRGALAPARTRPDCPDNAAPGPLCRPDAMPWFVLLQSIDR
jgi:hypothetical protein